MFIPTKKQGFLATVLIAPWLILGACSMHKPVQKTLPAPIKIEVPYTVTKTAVELCAPKTVIKKHKPIVKATPLPVAHP